jgi:hypothetical protein
VPHRIGNGRDRNILEPDPLDRCAMAPRHVGRAYTFCLCLVRPRPSSNTRRS